MGSDVRQHNQEAVSKKATGGTPHSPYAIAVLSPAIDKLPSTSVSPASPSNNAIFDKDQSVMLDKTINSNTYEVNTEAGHHTLDVLNEGNGPAPNNTSPPIAKTRGSDQGPLVETASIERSNEHFSGHKELMPRVPNKPKPPNKADVKWPSQGVSGEGLRVVLRPPEPTAALTPPTSMLIRLPWAYSHTVSARP